MLSKCASPPLINDLSYPLLCWQLPYSEKVILTTSKFYNAAGGFRQKTSNNRFNTSNCEYPGGIIVIEPNSFIS
jgi:hypothetical protein